MELRDLEAVLRDRLATAPADSYSAGLLRDPERAQRKIMEEAFELCLELGRGERDPRRTAEEAADLVFHVLVGLVGADVSLDDVLKVLEERRR
jgi:phosphoribosyl-ATP pyrophosphohydrolase